MTRHKISDKERKRIANACIPCKQRKQKCNGQQPCESCRKRDLRCHYKPEVSSFAHLSTENKHGTNQIISGSIAACQSDLPQLFSVPQNDVESPNYSPLMEIFTKSTQDQKAENIRPWIQDVSFHGTVSSKIISDLLSASITDSEDEKIEEVTLHVLRHDHYYGRLVYSGNSATVACLERLRLVVEQDYTLCSFTYDPDRHSLLELPNSPAESYFASFSQDILTKEIVDILTQSYFEHTGGLVVLFDQSDFRNSVGQLYSNETPEKSNLCLIYLVLAIGFAMMNPESGCYKDALIKQLKETIPDLDHKFFDNAKFLLQELNGFENADIWSVQAHCLMTVYMLITSRPIAAYAYNGMAVRSACTLGLHETKDTMVVFGTKQGFIRQHLWRSLLVLDTFLASSHGYPTAVTDNDVDPDAITQDNETEDLSRTDTVPTHSFVAIMISSRFTSKILKKIYSKKKTTARQAQKLLQDCDLSKIHLHPSLDARKLQSEANRPDVIPIVHAHLIRCNSILLLSRPFFLCEFFNKGKGAGSDKGSSQQQCSYIHELSGLCLQTSMEMVQLVHIAHQRNTLSQSNPFVLEFLFAATLVIIANEFWELHPNEYYQNSTTASIMFMKYCSPRNTRAQQWCRVIETFKLATAEFIQKRQSTEGNQPNRTPATVSGSLPTSPDTRSNHNALISDSSGLHSPEVGVESSQKVGHPYTRSYDTIHIPTTSRPCDENQTAQSFTEMLSSASPGSFIE